MATKKGKEKATPKSTAKRGTKRALVAEPLTNEFLLV